MRGHMWLNKVASVLGPLRETKLLVSGRKRIRLVPGLLEPFPRFLPRKKKTTNSPPNNNQATKILHH